MRLNSRDLDLFCLGKCLWLYLLGTNDIVLETKGRHWTCSIRHLWTPIMIMTTTPMVAVPRLNTYYVIVCPISWWVLYRILYKLFSIFLLFKIWGQFHKQENWSSQWLNHMVKATWLFSGQVGTETCVVCGETRILYPSLGWLAFQVHVLQDSNYSWVWQ